MAFERAEREVGAARRRALLTFVVVGGGPTGVEMAGALAEIARQSLARDFRHIDPVVGAHPDDRSGPGGAGDVSGAAARFRAPRPGTARRRGSDRTGGDATSRQGSSRWAPSGSRRETVVWAAGVAASPLGATLGAPLDRAGRVRVQPDLTIPGHPDVFVIGDLASLDGPNGRPYPGVAQVAIQMGRHAAANIMRAIETQPLAPFHYRDLGNMATIGRASAVADFGWLQLKGLLGWLVVGVRPHPEPDRLPQPAGRLRPVGVGLFQLSAVDPPDHR